MNKKTNTEPKFYISSSNVEGKSVLLHRWLMDAPKGKVVDHKNQDTLDNRLFNLRICNYNNNAANSKDYISNTSGHKGVLWNTKENKWMAYLMIHRKHKTLGYFDNIKDAILCRKQGEEKYFGEYKPIN